MKKLFILLLLLINIYPVQAKSIDYPGIYTINTNHIIYSKKKTTSSKLGTISKGKTYTIYQTYSNKWGLIS